MKKILILSMPICLAIICSCQKQDSTVEQQLAQRKAELDAREKALEERLNALDEKVNALDERVNLLAENEKAISNARTTPTNVQTPDPAQVQAEREAAMQQFSAEIRAQIPDDAKMKAGSDRKRQPGLEQLQNQMQHKLDKMRMSGAAVFPATQANSPTPSPAVETPLPTSSPTPQ
jgi:hypothetical protein